MRKITILSSIFGLSLFVYAHAGALPKIEEALNREVPVEGFIFDIQSNNPNFYEDNLSFIREQLEIIYDYSLDFRVIVLSRGKELESFLTLNHRLPSHQMFKFYSNKYGLEIEIDIKTAVSLGYSESSFPRIVKISSNSYITIVSGRADNMVVLELERMTMQEKSYIKLSPTWRTDYIK